MGFRIKTSERACSAVQVSCGGDQIDVYVGTSDAKLIALANGYVKLEPGQVVVDEHSFNDEEVDYLLEAIEPMKCNDCNEQCRSKARGMCLYLNIRAKLTEIKEARDE